MLDTSICIELSRRAAPDLLAPLAGLRPFRVGISTITFAELCCGVAKSRNPTQNMESLRDFCAPFVIIPFDEAAAEAYGSVRASLELAGTPIGSLDTLIAAHALALNVTVITKNEREFRRVPGLRVENWLKT